MTLALLLACAPSPTWTEPAALAPHLARLDADHDGRVTAPEYDAHRWNGPPFRTADRDHDGALGVDELARLTRAQPAVGFDGTAAAAPVHRAGAGVEAPAGAARDAWEVLVWMDGALRARGLAGVAPEAVAAVVDAGGLDSEPGRAALAALRPRWEAAGYTWPEGLP